MYERVLEAKGHKTASAPASTKKPSEAPSSDLHAPDSGAGAERVTSLIRTASSATLPHGAALADSRDAPIQRVVKAQKTGANASTDQADFKAFSKYFGVKQPALRDAIAAKFFITTHFPDSYESSYAENDYLKGEVFRMADKLIQDSASVTVAQAASGDVGAVATALWTVISPAVDLPFLNGFSNFKAMKGLGSEDSSSFAGLLDMAVLRLKAYQSQINKKKWDPGTLKQNSLAEAKIEELSGRVSDLRKSLGAAAGVEKETAPLMVQVKQLTAEIERFEKAWELDWRATDEGVEAEVQTLSENTTDATSKDVGTVGNQYQDDGGTDDGMNVSDKWTEALGCTLYSILALKGSWLGTDKPAELHQILRKSKELAVYDENRIAAKVRLLAGMTATAVGGGMTVRAYIEAEAKTKKPESVIMDTAGVAHTFAAVWDGKKFVRSDEIHRAGNFNDYNANEVLWTWK